MLVLLCTMLGSAVYSRMPNAQSYLVDSMHDTYDASLFILYLRMYVYQQIGLLATCGIVNVTYIGAYYWCDVNW
jgi:hypothetical protein